MESFFAETRDIIRLEFHPSEILADAELGVASVAWTLTATIRKSDVRVSVPGMSSLHFRDGLVCEENDHYAATDVLKTLLRYHPIRTLRMAKRDLLS
ncbi:MAG: nuclear transport factor 2 family protein [Pseudomonadota bacterium]